MAWFKHHKKKLFGISGALGLLMLGGFVAWQVFVLCLPAFDLAQHMKAKGLEHRLSSSVIVTDRRERLLRAFTAKDGRWRLPVRQDKIAPHYFQLLLNFEDKGFYAHKGIEPKAFVRAAWQWVKNGRVISGGSTLSMQVARLLEKRKNQSLTTK